MYCCKIMCLQRLYMIRPRNRVNEMISIIKHMKPWHGVCVCLAFFQDDEFDYDFFSFLCSYKSMLLSLACILSLVSISIYNNNLCLEYLFYIYLYIIEYLIHIPSNNLQEIIRYLGLTFICMALI